MKTWEISGKNLPILLILASCFDDALEVARKVNPNYNTGRVAEFDLQEIW